MSEPRVIAFYLPQYYPFPENDEWWGKGFTEWTSVGRAKPLYKGHYQPKVPTDLGYYDLRVPSVREQQAQLAREAGIEGFLYWHYWFGNGKRLMWEVFDEVLNSGKPDYPFCLGWANHSWYAKNWNKSATKGPDRLLIEQKYFGEEDFRQHFDYVLKAFKDERYLKQDGKPIFIIFNTVDLPDDFIPLWRKWAKEAGLPGIFFVGQMRDGSNYEDIIEKGYDCATPKPSFRWAPHRTIMERLILKMKRFTHPGVSAIPYKDMAPYLTNQDVDQKEEVIPFMMPNWDHSPRSGNSDVIFHNCDPKYFYEHAKRVLELVKKKQNKIVFLKSWNEWGEGNYMEPDIKYGKGYINALRRAISDVFQV